jgi:hypothetical protein
MNGSSSCGFTEFISTSHIRQLPDGAHSSNERIVMNEKYTEAVSLIHMDDCNARESASGEAVKAF